MVKLRSEVFKSSTVWGIVLLLSEIAAVRASGKNATEP